jgi:hypothetical protein
MIIKFRKQKITYKYDITIRITDPKPKSENFQGSLRRLQKISENKNKTNYLINLE